MGRKLVKKLFARWKSLAVIGCLALIYLITKPVRPVITWHLEGLFLLNGTNGWKYELSDDLYVGDGERLIHTFADFHDPLYRFVKARHASIPYLYSSWDGKDGSGLVRNIFPDGRQILTCFGRYVGDDKLRVHGIFVGGGLPESVDGKNDWLMNETGMAYFDGARWYHIWCNSNEGLYLIKGMEVLKNIPLQFDGSRVINESSQSLAIASRHTAITGDAVIGMERYAYLRAGDTYFVLTIRLVNHGKTPVTLGYVYGDEPWVGNYGTSRGDVGWIKGQRIEYETEIDSGRNSYAGIFNYGSDVMHEGHNFTNKANFIEWFGLDRPKVYFANAGGNQINDRMKVPLSSNARFIGLEWKPTRLAPGQSVSYNLAIGMAPYDPETAMPVKPVVRLPDEITRQISR